MRRIKSKISLGILTIFSLSNCIQLQPSSNSEKPIIKTDSSNISDNSNKMDNSYFDKTKEVQIQILNPENSSSVEWYKKDDKKIIMKIGSQANLIGTTVLKDGTKSSNVEWSSSDNTIAVVNNGKVTANKLGVTTILATSVLDSSHKGLLDVEVVDNANFATSERDIINDVKNISVNTLGDQGASLEWFNTGDVVKAKNNISIPAIAVVTLSDGTKNSNVIWESSDPNIAIIDDKGNIKTKAFGQTTIVAKYKLNPDKKAILNLSVIGSSGSNASQSQENSTNTLGSIYFQESFENGLDKWITEKDDFYCTYIEGGGGRKLKKNPFTWANGIFFKTKNGNAQDGNKFLVSNNSEGVIPVNSSVPINIIKTKDVIDFSQAKIPRLQLYLKSGALPSKSVKFKFYISSKPDLIGGDRTMDNQCEFGFQYGNEETTNLSKEYTHPIYRPFGVPGIFDLTYPITFLDVEVSSKDWVKKDFDLSGYSDKAGYLVMAVIIKDNIVPFDGVMIDNIKIYDAG